jgi:hypothetical protein
VRRLEIPSVAGKLTVTPGGLIAPVSDSQKY